MPCLIGGKDCWLPRLLCSFPTYNILIMTTLSAASDIVQCFPNCAGLVGCEAYKNPRQAKKCCIFFIAKSNAKYLFLLLFWKCRFVSASFSFSSSSAHFNMKVTRSMLHNNAVLSVFHGVALACLVFPYRAEHRTDMWGEDNGKQVDDNLFHYCD